MGEEEEEGSEEEGAEEVEFVVVVEGEEEVDMEDLLLLDILARVGSSLALFMWEGS